MRALAAALVLEAASGALVHAQEALSPSTVPAARHATAAAREPPALRSAETLSNSNHSEHDVPSLSKMSLPELSYPRQVVV